MILPHDLSLSSEEKAALDELHRLYQAGALQDLHAKARETNAQFPKGSPVDFYTDLFLADLQVKLGHHEAAERLLERCEGRYFTTPTAPFFAPLQYAFGELYFAMGRLADARIRYRSAQESAAARGDRAIADLSLVALGRVAVAKLDRVQAAEVLAELAPRTHSFGDALRVKYLVMEANVLILNEDYESALTRYLEASAFAVEVGDLDAQARIAGSLGLIYYHKSQFDHAVNQFTRCAEYCRQGANRRTLSTTLNNKAHMLTLMGRYDEAATNYDAAQTAVEQIETESVHGTLTLSMAEYEYWRGNLDSCLRLLEEYDRLRAGFEAEHYASPAALLKAFALMEQGSQAASDEVILKAVSSTSPDAVLNDEKLLRVIHDIRRSILADPSRLNQEVLIDDWLAKVPHGGRVRTCWYLLLLARRLHRTLDHTVAWERIHDAAPAEHPGVVECVRRLQA